MTNPDPAETRVLEALRAAADAASEARAVLGVARDPAGGLIDLRILYGNRAYWAMVGLDPAAALGETFGELGIPLDFGSGIVGLVAEAAKTGRGVERRRFLLRPQLGPHAGEERWTEIEVAAADDVVALAFQDVTEAVAVAERRLAEHRRTEALARFLRAAVEPTIDRRGLLDLMARIVAETFDGLCLVAEQEPGGDLRLVGAAGGGPEIESLVRRLVGARIEVSAEARPIFLAGGDVVLASLPEP